MAKKNEKSNYYNFSLRIEKGSVFDKWLSGQENRSNSLKALMLNAYKRYGDEDLLMALVTENGPLEANGKQNVQREEAGQADMPIKTTKQEPKEEINQESDKIEKTERGSASNWRQDLF